MAPDSAELGLDVEAGPLADGISKALSLFTSFGSKVTGAIGAVGSGISATFRGALNIVTGFAAKIRDALATAFNVFFDQIPLFMADFRTGFAAGVSGVRELEAALFKANAQVKITGQFAGRTVDDMYDLAGALRDVSTFSKAAAVDAQAAATQFLNVRGDVFDDLIRGAADMASAVGGDLTSATTQLGAALNDPIAGLDSLTQAGVRFTQQESLMIKQLAQSGRLLDAQHAILGRVSEVFGGAATAKAKTFGGQIDRLNNMLQDMWSAIAQSLVPAFEVVLPYIESSTKATTRAAEGFGEWVVEIVNWASQSLPVIEKWYDSLVEAATSAGKWVVDKMVQAFSFVQSVIQDAPQAWDAATKKMQYYWESMTASMREMWDEVIVGIENMFANAAVRIKGKMLSLALDVSNSILNNTGLAKLMGVDTKAMNMGIALTKTVLENQKAPDQRVAAGRSSATQAHLDELKRVADEAGGVFGKRFDENLARNRETIGNVMDEAAKRLGLNTDFELDKAKKRQQARDSRSVAASRNPYALSPESAGAGSGGGFEDLASLNRRIQSASFKSPVVSALDRQTGVLNGILQAQRSGLAAAQRAAAEQVAASRETTNAVRSQEPGGAAA